MSNELLKHRLKRELRSRGVRVNRLLLDVSDDRIVVSGEVTTYYEVQLIQVYASELAAGRPVHNNLSVVPRVLDGSTLDALSQNGTGHEVHRLRNRLNALALGIRSLDQVISLGDFTKAKALTTEMLNAISSAETDARISHAWISRLALLVIEDDLHQCLLLTGLLRHLGAEVARAGDADSAFRVLNEGFTPHIVLLDMHLPDNDGANVARAIRLRPHCQQTRILVLSGTHPSDVGLEFDKGEIDAWLPKPINVDKLLETIRLFSKSES